MRIATLVPASLTLRYRCRSLGMDGGIIPRTSVLNLDVRFSLHPAFDVLSFRFGSCAGSHDISWIHQIFLFPIN
ncbi:hypothetical protein [Nostoc sp. DedSLP03]|uniref:hypothetical protein n=1 Tax=Nostoc sp. DedSLP03 TaxID=3075400 RepID=UPI002AD30BED|nr:hypothetical protein [Nostoc sp. DedSLP03]